jgi:hypothetical protein
MESRQSTVAPHSRRRIGITFQPSIVLLSFKTVGNNCDTSIQQGPRSRTFHSPTTNLILFHGRGGCCSSVIICDVGENNEDKDDDEEDDDDDDDTGRHDAARTS